MLLGMIQESAMVNPSYLVASANMKGEGGQP